MQKVNFTYEIVVGEDCSTDSTKKILLEYKNKYPKCIKLISHNNNVGMIQNGLSVNNACQGDYIAFLDGDDYWTDENKLQIQIDQMRKYQDCHLSFHSAIYAFEDKSKENIIECRHAMKDKIFTTREVIVGGGGFCPTFSLMIKSEVLKNLPNWFIEVPVGDYFVQILGSVKGGALYIDKPMSVYRRNTPASWTLTIENINKKTELIREWATILDKLNSSLGYEYSSEIRMIESNMYFKLAKLCLRQCRFKEFKYAIEKSHNEYMKKSIKRYIFLFKRVSY